MKNVLKLACLLFLSVACFGQNPKTCAQQVDVSATVSGTVLTVPNDCRALHATFAEDILGGPTTVSIVLAGCVHNSTSPCATLDTNTSTSSTYRKPTIDSVYDYFTFTTSWTGGSSVKINVYSSISAAGASSGAGAVTALAVDNVFAGTGKCYIFKGTTPGTNDGCDNPAGSGNVTGAASSVVGHVPIFSDTTGKVLADSSFPLPLVATPVSHQFLTGFTATTGAFSLAAILAGDVPTLNQNTTGSAASFTGSLAGDVTGTQGATVVGKINGTSLAGLATGLLKNTTTTGVPSIASVVDIDSLYTGAGKCYLFKGTTPGTNDGCDNPSGSGNVVGPGSSTVGHFALFNNTTGTLLSDGGAPAAVATSGSATDLTVGTLNHARLPTLLSGDIPNNAANTTGTAGGLTGSPAITVSSCTGCGSGGPGTGTLNQLPYWATTTTLGSVGSAITGQIPQMVNGSAPIVASPGTGDSPNSPVTTASYTIACDDATHIIDRGTTIRFRSGASTPVVPLSSATGCSHLMTKVMDDGAGSLVFGRSGTDTFTISDGVTATDGATSFTLTNGQTAYLNQAATSIWEVWLNVGNASSLNGTSLAGLATGLLKNTTATGVPSIAVAGDIPNIAESQVTNLTTDLAAKQATLTGTGLARNTGASSELSGVVVTSGSNVTTPGKDDVSNSNEFCAAAGASGTAYTCNFTPAITGYVTGVHYRFKADVANTAAATIAINGLAATTIKKAAGGITTDVVANDFRAGQWVDLIYDGTNMQMQSTLGNAPAGGVTSVFTRTGAVVATSGDYTLDQIGNPAADKTFTLPIASTTGLTFAGTAPASVSTTPGTAATTLFNVNGVAGGASSNAAGVGGVGSAPSVSGGIGGAGTGTNASGGAGGSVTLTAGNGGASLGTAANSNGGNVALTPGTAGTGGSGTAGKAGVVSITGTNAGFIGLTQGTANTTANTNIPANTIIDQAPTAVTAYANTRPVAASSGILQNVNSSNVVTQSYSGDGSHALTQASKTAAVTTFTLCAATAGTACGQVGQYKVSYNFWGSGTACSAVTAGSVGLNLTWTDENAVAHTTISVPMWDQKSAANGILFNFNTALGTEGASGSYNISTNGTIIQAATTYTACTTGTGTYNLRMTVEQLQ